MTLTASKPRGRRPGHDDTRGTIKAAAARLFQRDGYDRVSLRAIAREADVDPALVHHYFASKVDLFCQAIFDVPWEGEAHIQRVLSGDPADIGRRAARAFLDYWDEQGRYRDFLATLAGDATAGQRVLTEMLGRELFAPIASRFGHSNAVLRGQLAVSALLGVVIARHALDLPVLASVSARTLANPVGQTLQYYLVEPW